MRVSLHFKVSQVFTLLLILIIGVVLFSQARSTVHAAGVSITGTRSFTFNAANFPHSTRIDNPYYPLPPGTEFIYTGTEGGMALTDSVFVTHQTKTILGIPTVVVLDAIYMKNGQLFEKTYDWYAQDQYSNVWYFGEYATQYKNGKPIGHSGSWEAGVHGAQPGKIMEGNPIVGDIYRQEYQKGVAEDMAGVLSLNAYVCVPYNCYFNDALLTKEWSPLEPGVVEHKWYAQGVGFLKSITVKGGTEEFVLVDIKQH
jgi:hypothetical protein